MVGLLPQTIRSSVSGNLKVAIHDGAVNGINLAAMLREAKAALKGQSSPDVATKTDFSALTADIRFDQGKASSTNIAMMSPLLRVSGSVIPIWSRRRWIFISMSLWLPPARGRGGIWRIFTMSQSAASLGGLEQSRLCARYAEFVQAGSATAHSKTAFPEATGKLGSLFN